MTLSHDGPLLISQTWTGTISGSVEWIYDSYFQVSSQTVNGTNAAVYEYDLDGLVVRAGELQITRSPDTGSVVDAVLGGVASAHSVNEFGEMASCKAIFFDGVVETALFEEVATQRDALGRILQKEETVSGVTATYEYSYDTRGQLTDVYRDGQHVRNYSYDANGNRVSLQDFELGTIQQGVHDAQDRLFSYGDLDFTYSGNGELQVRFDSATSETTSYEYDELGNLTGVGLPDGRYIEYVIDGSNRRVGRKVDGVLVQGLLYQDGLNPVAELDGTGNVVARFVYGTRPYVPDYMERSGETYRFVVDHLGSVRVVVNASSGEIAQRLEYDEFGRVLEDTNPGFQPFGFAGGLHDSDTGLVRFGARDYDPETGRWTSKDPILFAGGDLNLYVYVHSDPVNFRDPTGLELVINDINEFCVNVVFLSYYEETAKCPVDACGRTDRECYYDKWRASVEAFRSCVAANGVEHAK